MVSVKCADVTCKYLSDHSNTCKAKRINLSWHCVATVNMGQQEFLKCKSYEKSERTKELEAALLSETNRSIRN